MNTLRALRSNTPLATVLAFALACAIGFGFLWIKAGGSVPLVTETNDYRLTFHSVDVKNLRGLGDVRIAGVKVGTVEKQEVDGEATTVEISLDREAAPLHEGAMVRVGVKMLVGSSYVDVIDGDGPEIENGSTLPNEAVHESVDVDELFATLDAPTRKSLVKTVDSLDVATRGTGKELDRVMTGLGQLGTSGHTVLDVVAAQSEDLTALTREATQLLDALDTGHGQIAGLVRDAHLLTGATAGQREALEKTVASLPSLLTAVRSGAIKLEELSGPLAPIARDLRAAAPDLNQALVELPAVTDDLRGLLPALDGSIDAAPATLSRVPAVAADLESLVPHARATLRDVNPMLAYLSPYGRDLGAMFANFGATMTEVTKDGVRPIRLATVFGPGSVRGVPAKVDLGPLYWANPYPAPGNAAETEPFRGKYPRIQRDSE